MEKECVSNDLSNWSIVSFSTGLVLEPFCLGCFAFFFLRGRIWEKNYQNLNPKVSLKSTNTRSVPKSNPLRIA